MTALLTVVPIVLVLLPLLGAGLTLCMPSLPAARQLALSNLLVSSVLMVTAVAAYHPGLRDEQGRPVTVQMRRSLPWIGNLMRESMQENPEVPRSGPVLNLSFGFDGVSIWLAGTVCLLTLSVLQTWWPRVDDRLHLDLALLLAAQSAAMGIFTTRNVIVLVFCSGAVSLCLALLIGLVDSQNERRTAGLRILKGQWASDLLLLFVVLGTYAVTSRMFSFGDAPFQVPSLDIDRMTIGVGRESKVELPGLVWETIKSWLFLAALLGIAMKCAMYPFHRRWLLVWRHLRPGTQELALLLPLLIGGFLALRVVLPLFHPMLQVFGLWLRIWLMWTVAGCSLMCLSGPHEPDRIACYASAGMALVLLGLLSTVPECGLCATHLLPLGTLGVLVLIRMLRSSEPLPESRDPSARMTVSVLIAGGMLPAGLALVTALGGVPGLSLRGLLPGLTILLLACLLFAMATAAVSRDTAASWRPGAVTMLLAVLIAVWGCSVASVSERMQPTISLWSRGALPDLSQTSSSPAMGSEAGLVTSLPSPTQAREVSP